MAAIPILWKVAAEGRARLRNRHPYSLNLAPSASQAAALPALLRRARTRPGMMLWDRPLKCQGSLDLWAKA
jgi:hypothetical protein